MIRVLAVSAFLVAAAFSQVQVTPVLNLDGASEPALSPDHRTLLFNWCAPNYQCGIYARPFAGGEVVPLIGHDSKESTPVSPKWSPDGRRIAFARPYLFPLRSSPVHTRLRWRAGKGPGSDLRSSHKLDSGRPIRPRERVYRKPSHT